MLKCGMFGIMEPLEPMSNFKWLKLIELSKTEECQGFIYEGMVKYVNSNGLTFSDKVREVWAQTILDTENHAQRMDNVIADMFQKFSVQPKLYYPVLLRGRAMATLYNNPRHYYCNHIDWYIPTEEKAREADAWASREAQIITDINPNKIRYKYQDILVENNHYVEELMNKELNKALQTTIIREKSYYKPTYIEINQTKIEVLPPSANILMLIAHLMQHILIQDVKPQMIADLGIFLRKLGHLVDYVKLERWLNELGMQKMADLEAGLLMELFAFTPDELPFMKDVNKNDVQGLLSNIFSEEYMKPIDEFSFGKKTQQSFKNLYRTATTFKYHPREVTGVYVQKVAKVFKQIEE